MMRFSVIRLARINKGNVVASFEVGLGANEVVIFGALLLRGPRGYFVAPACVRDQDGRWQRKVRMTPRFAKAVCTQTLRILGIEEPAETQEPAELRERSKVIVGGGSLSR